jgi:two-component system nitrate/nitrite response regulator NarL
VPIRLILADDHPIVLQGLQRLFSSHEEFDVISSCADGMRAIEAVRTHRPDVLVLDLKMPGKNGLDVLGALAAEGLDCRTVLLTAALDDNQAVDAVRLGAMGVVLKESSPEVLLECVRKVHRGERWLDHDTMSRAVGRVLLRESAAREVARALTPREIEMVQLVAQGLRNKVIADRLSISEGTVKIHLHNIYEKLGVDGRLELVLYAQLKGLV